MKRLSLSFAIIVLASFASSGQASQLEGEWVSVSPRTRGITRLLIIAADSTGWTIQAWGKCHPRDCEWGSRPLTPIGDSVDDASFTRGFAIWHPGFASKYLLVAAENDLLKVETITIFKDRSRRSSFHATEYLRRTDRQVME